MTTESRYLESGDWPLQQRAAMRPRRNLLFTSAGDHSNLHRWLRGNRNFDLWITYYGTEPGRLSEVADLYNVRRDSKFGNLKFAFDSWPDAFAPYDAVLIADDDLLISGAQISGLFDLRAQLDLWLLQPAFSPLGKISWPITRAQWQCHLRYTNFVEMTCPLFRKDKLDAFMAVFDPVLTGTGTDWWFMQVLGEDIDGKVAIIDSVTCVNPFDRSKGGARELYRLQSEEQMAIAWNTVRDQCGVERIEPVEFGKIHKPLPRRWLSWVLHSPIDVYASVRGLAWKMKRTVTSWRVLRG